MDLLGNYNFTNSSKLVSFDIESLFTNVPLDETIDIAVNKVYNNNNPKQPPYSREVFKSLLKLATSGVFSFNDKLYN